jgi:Ser/Thr protein kinase RdoA (MazF antagonist)
MADNPNINLEALILALSKKFDTRILRADWQAESLHGGIIANVNIITGIARTADGDVLPYSVVLKIQKKWERQGDPNSWRREYDFYKSDFGTLFTDSLRWPYCYHAAINREETETQLWLEYIDGISGNDLTVDMLEKAAEEIGRFHGRLYRLPEISKPEILKNINFFSMSKGQKYYYFSCRERVAGYIRSDDCPIPKHLRQLLIDIADDAEKIFIEIEKFPTVLSHRDFWLENIFYIDGTIRLIDWDSTGWGYMTEDITQLIVGDSDTRRAEDIEEYYRRLIPAYIKGFSEYVDITEFSNLYIWELMIIKFTGYRLIYWYMLAESEEIKTQQIAVLQKIYEMGKCYTTG